MCKNLALSLSIMLLMVGCAVPVEKYLGSTEASYGDLHYKSNKNQENLKAKAFKDVDGSFSFEIETTATTPESAIAAAAAANAETAKILSKIFDALMAGAQR